ncbi:hypothetical protein CathTA2_2850 [Caldalkalibacillus thermarum TA2.A1]|uniref:ABC transporter permease n=1 Tax=Caldalkalibacillus thermarum (strain TA2.A1) TaxID=986075 RepID=F5LAB5_CALTT|nr:ABC transporter permease subunit [Caldalkalibacillus thermarum]EGL81664.1 hypothetical protein CathTA2_2850 [Caldalkalibacillus thermarum TA2.A1]QZT33260.1 ABC transporter permease [Caldalkalibacillus thermarum TA2.A1]
MKRICSLLLWKEWFNHKGSVLGLFLFFLLSPVFYAIMLHLPLEQSAVWQEWRTWSFWQAQFNLLWDGGIFALVPLHLLAVFIFGGRLVMKEKKQRTLDFLLTLPISRGQALSSKWWFGVLSLSVIFLVWLGLLALVSGGRTIDKAAWSLAALLFALYVFVFSIAFFSAVFTQRLWMRMLLTLNILSLPFLVILGLSWWVGYSLADLRAFREEWKWLEAPVLLGFSFVLYWLASSGFKYVSLPADRK